MGKTIDVDTLKQNLSHLNDGGDEKINSLINKGDIMGLIEYINSQNNQLILANRTIDATNKKIRDEMEELENRIEEMADEKFKEMKNEHEELRRTHNDLLGHVKFLKSIFGG